MGLESLKNNWYGDDFCYDEPVIATAKNVLQAIIPSIEKQLVKAKAQSPQKTLNTERLHALQLAIDSLENRL